MISFIKGRKALKLLVAPLAARTAIKGLTVSLGVEEFWLFFCRIVLNQPQWKVFEHECQENPNRPNVRTLARTLQNIHYFIFEPFCCYVSNHRPADCVFGFGHDVLLCIFKHVWQ